jgi:hypothetical protein
MAVGRSAGVRLPGRVAAAVALMLLAAGCTPGTEEPSGPVLQTGGDYLVDHWPLRGSLAGDAGLRDEVTAVVAGWRTPDGVGTHDLASALLWLGEVDGAVLGVVDFRPADNPNKTWLLELTGEPGGLAVTGARSYDGTVLNEHLLPVRSAGTRYLASTGVGALAGPAGPLPPEEGGLTGRVAVARCRVTGLTVRVAGGERWYADLGTGLAAPFYPLLGDGWLGGPAAPALAGVDTCAAMAPDGWLGSLGEADGGPARVGDPPELRRLGAHDRRDRALDLPGSLTRVHIEYTADGGAVLLAYWLLWAYPAGGLDDVAVRGSGGVETVLDGPGTVVIRLPRQTMMATVELAYTRDGESARVTLSPP